MSISGKGDTLIVEGLRGWRIRWDGSMNWLLEEPVKRSRKATAEKYDDYHIHGYYSKPEEALIVWGKARATKLDKVKLVEYIAEVDKINNEIRGLMGIKV